MLPQKVGPDSIYLHQTSKRPHAGQVPKKASNPLRSHQELAQVPVITKSRSTTATCQIRCRLRCVARIARCRGSSAPEVHFDVRDPRDPKKVSRDGAKRESFGLVEDAQGEGNQSERGCGEERASGCRGGGRVQSLDEGGIGGAWHHCWAKNTRHDVLLSTVFLYQSLSTIRGIGGRNGMGQPPRHVRFRQTRSLGVNK